MTDKLFTNTQYRNMANAIRALTIDAIEKANSGHPGMPMGMADVATILYSEFFNFMPTKPKWKNRDRLILSAGHGSMLLYSLLYLTGYEDITIDDLKSFRQIYAKTAGHPEYEALFGVETTTGPLGHGIANAVGMAITAKKLQAKFGNHVADYKIFVICGDGCLMEGISHEAISIAGHLGLDNLILLFDNNSISIDGPTTLTCSDDHLKRFEASNWSIFETDGHNFDEIRLTLSSALYSPKKPSIISCKTTIGYGSLAKQATEKCHGSPLGKEEAKKTKENLGWSANDFEIPSDIVDLWRSIAKRCEKKYKLWQESIPSDYPNFVSNNNYEYLNNDFLILKKSLSDNNDIESTRQSSGNIINFLSNKIPYLIGGSADLSESNVTKSESMMVIKKNNFHGNYIHYGIREHAMVAIMNGISLDSPYVPYAGSFLVFTDFARPAIRLAAIMNRKIILIMTHDSIGLGEDGPTHQPIEHLSSLRAMPNLYLFRPADKVEVLESWQLALSLNAPSVISLTRQTVANIRTKFEKNNLTAKGAYIIKDSTLPPKVVIFATGSEVQIAVSAAAKLEYSNISTRVISVPCWEFFAQQHKEYRDSIINAGDIKVAIEAACSFGWEKFIGQNGIFIGISSFGASGKAKDLFEHFKITEDEIIKKVMEKL